MRQGIVKKQVKLVQGKPGQVISSTLTDSSTKVEYKHWVRPYTIMLTTGFLI